jgi:hypothetical protein
MTTYDESVTLSLELGLAGSGNVNFSARPVSNLLVFSQGLGGLTPEVISYLEPEQTIVGVLPKVTSYLEPVQTITNNIRMGTVTTTLVPEQTIETNIKNGILISYLEPVQTITTDNSILSNASFLPHEVQLDITVVDSGTFHVTPSNTLIPLQSATAYCLPFVTIGTNRYKADAVFTGSYETYFGLSTFASYTFAATTFNCLSFGFSGESPEETPVGLQTFESSTFAGYTFNSIGAL